MGMLGSSWLERARNAIGGTEFVSFGADAECPVSTELLQVSATVISNHAQHVDALAR
jgi:hypothetical protein